MYKNHTSGTPSFTRLNLENLAVDLTNINLAPIYSCDDANIALNYLIGALQT